MINQKYFKVVYLTFKIHQTQQHFDTLHHAFTTLDKDHANHTCATHCSVLFCYWHHISVTITCVTIQNTKTQKILEHPSTVSGECDAVVNYHDITFCEFSFKLICSLFFLFCCLFRYSSAGILPRLTESSLR